MADLVTCNGDDIVPFDDRAEWLFRRLSPNDHKDGNINFGWRYDKRTKTIEDGISMDRGRCIAGDPRENLPSEKRHYLLLKLAVSSLLTTSTLPAAAGWTFRMQHVPEKDVNHAHSELRVFDGADRQVSPTKALSSWYRQEMQKLLDKQEIELIEPIAPPPGFAA